VVEPRPGEGPALSRRKLLALAGVAGAGAFVAACGGGGGGGGGGAGAAGGGHGGLNGTISVIQPQGTAASPDVAILNRALALEHRAVATYAAVVPRLGGEEKAFARTFSDQEQQHVSVLETAVRALGAIPARPRADYGLPRLRTGEQALSLAIALEDLLLASHLEALPRLSSPDLRGTFASILTVEAEHGAVLSGRSEALPAGDLGAAR
jgi:Ferritin-like domain